MGAKIWFLNFSPCTSNFSPKVALSYSDRIAQRLLIILKNDHQDFEGSTLWQLFQLRNFFGNDLFRREQDKHEIRYHDCFFCPLEMNNISAVSPIKSAFPQEMLKEKVKVKNFTSGSIFCMRYFPEMEKLH